MLEENNLSQEKELMESHLQVLQVYSCQLLQILNGDQNSLKRFLYCCAEKLYKCSIALQKLYSLVYEQEDIEFSIGIIMRSLLMDSILTQYLRYFTLDVTEENYEDTINE